MNIKCINSDGPHKNELAGLALLESSVEGMFGYSNLQLHHAGNRKENPKYVNLPEYDLIISTHQFLLCVELKNYFGDLEFDGRSWIHNGFQEVDHYNKISIKSFQLSKILERYWKKQVNDEVAWPYIVACIVFTGKVNFKQSFKNYINEGGKFIFHLDGFIRLLNIKNIKHFNEKFDRKTFGSYSLKDYKSSLDNFFLGKSFFSDKKFLYGGEFLADEYPVYEHPNLYYCEFNARNPKNEYYRALIRIWYFENFPIQYTGMEFKKLLLEREKKVYSYIMVKKPTLKNTSFLLMPTGSSADNIDSIKKPFEVFQLQENMLPINNFLNKNSELDNEKRENLARSLLTYFQHLHSIDLFHRDICEHKLWVNDKYDLTVTGLHTASFPDIETISQFRNDLVSLNVRLPEKYFDDTEPEPAQSDVYCLARIVHLILFNEFPPMDEDSKVHQEWKSNNGIAYRNKFNNFFKKTLCWSPELRSKSAEEIKILFDECIDKCKTNETNYLLTVKQKKYAISDKYKDIKIIKKADAYQVGQFSVSGKSFILKSISIRDYLTEETQYNITNILEKIKLLKDLGSKVSPNILDYGVDRNFYLFLITERIEGVPLDIKYFKTKGFNFFTFRKKLLYFLEICNSLAMEGVIHNDLKSEHVYIDNNGYIYAIDWVDIQFLDPNAGQEENLRLIRKGVPTSMRGAILMADFLLSVLNQTNNERFKKYADQIMALKEDDHNPLTFENIAFAVESWELTRRSIEIYYDTKTPIFIKPFIEDKFIITIEKEKNQNRYNIEIIGFESKVEALIDSNGRILKLFLRRLYEKSINYFLHRVKDNHYDIFLRGKEIVLGKNRSSKLIEQAFCKRIESLQSVNLSDDIKSRNLKKEWGASLEEARQHAEWGTKLTSTNIEIIDKSNLKIGLSIRDFKMLSKLDADSLRIKFRNISGKGAFVDATLKDLDNVYYNVFVECNNTEFLAKQEDLASWEINFFNLESFHAYKKQFKAINNILEEKSVLPNLHFIFSGNTTFPLKLGKLLKNSVSNYNLNNTQRKALQIVLNENPISLVQGPPGTGKTYFIGALIHYGISNGIFNNILLVSQTHVAIDNALSKSKAIFQEKKSELRGIRIGKKERLNPLTTEFHTDCLGSQRYNRLFGTIERNIIKTAQSQLGLDPKYIKEVFNVYTDFFVYLHEFSREIDDSLESNKLDQQHYLDMVQNKYGIHENTHPEMALNNVLSTVYKKHCLTNRKLEKDLINLIKLNYEYSVSIKSSNIFEPFMVKTKNLVTGTCVGIAGRNTALESSYFDLVIIDEAARATPGELAISMQRGRKVLLVGDHKQLPPFLGYNEFNVNNTKANKYESEFEYLATNKAFENVSTMLDEQYRMADEICGLISNVFYDGKLKSSRTDSSTYAINNIFDKRVSWIDLKDEHNTAEQRKKYSFINNGEAQAIVNILKSFNQNEDFLKTVFSSEIPIGIISAYSAQAERISNMIRQETWNFDHEKVIKIGTVDSYQGEENSIIFLSLVRSNLKQIAGFTSSLNRINVSLSRAKDYVLIFGSLDFWDKIPNEHPISKVLNYIRDYSNDCQVIESTDI